MLIVLLYNPVLIRDPPLVIEQISILEQILTVLTPILVIYCLFSKKEQLAELVSGPMTEREWSELQNTLSQQA
jgi:cell division protein ZapA (FtsZ GTPase activity inhibitor)